MRRFVLWIAAVLLATGCTTASPAQTGITQTLDAVVQQGPALDFISTEFPVTVGTFANESYGWMIADRTRLLASTDAGRTWSHLATFDEDVRRLHFLSETHGWAFTEKRALATTDGGRTWQPIPADRVPARGVFLDEHFGWEIEQKDGVSPSFLRLTPDGGQTWSRQPTPCKTGLMQAKAAAFTDRQTGFLLCSLFQGSGGSSNWLFGTTDGGKSWELATGTIYGVARDGYFPGVVVGPKEPLPEGALPTSSGAVTISFLDSQHGLISFANSGPYVGHTYTTADGGRTWTQLPLPGGPFTGGFRFFTPRFGRILVNDDERWAWLETHDGGANWDQVYPPLAPVLTGTPVLRFETAEYGLAARTMLDPHAVLATEDGGRTWLKAPNGKVEAPAEVGPWSPRTLPGKAVSASLHTGGCGWAVVVGEAPGLDLSLLVTGNEGETWTHVKFSGIIPASVTSIDCTTAWITDSRGHLYRTTDGGERWDQVQ